MIIMLCLGAFRQKVQGDKITLYFSQIKCSFLQEDYLKQRQLCLGKLLGLHTKQLESNQFELVQGEHEESK